MSESAAGHPAAHLTGHVRLPVRATLMLLMLATDRLNAVLPILLRALLSNSTSRARPVPGTITRGRPFKVSSRLIDLRRVLSLQNTPDTPEQILQTPITNASTSLPLCYRITMTPALDGPVPLSFQPHMAGAKKTAPFVMDRGQLWTQAAHKQP